MAVAKFLAFDLGASSGRAVLGTIEAHQLTTREIYRFDNNPVFMLGHYYWNIAGLYDELKNALTKCAHEYTDDLMGLGIDTWGVDFGFVSKNKELVGLPYAYRDARTNDMMTKAFAGRPRAELYRRTGIQFMQFNSIFQLLAYVLEQSPLLAAADTLLFMPDLLNFMFCGERVTETSIASTSQLIDPYTRGWAPEIFRELSLPRHLMPEIVATGTELGKLLPAIARATGLSAVSLIATASHDTAAAVAAVPASGANWAYLSSGTWSLMGIEAAAPIITQQSLNYNFTNEGGVANTIRFLKNIAGLWPVQECRRIWNQSGKAFSFDTLTAMAKNATPFMAMIDANDPVFLMPENMPQTILDFLKRSGQKQPQTEGEMMRIILESLALNYRYVLDQLNEMRGQAIQQLHIVGGGTKNELLNQFAANACGIPVVAGPTEATAIGNIMVQAVTRGVLGSIATARAMIRESFPLQNYAPQDSDLWEAQYVRFKKLVT